jgi:hypothetical protein
MAVDFNAWMVVEEVTFYANGQRMSPAQVGECCRTAKRPFGAGRALIEDTTTPYLVSENLGYTVRNFRWHDKNERVMREVVSKIWSKGDHGWQIVHLQATLLPNGVKQEAV